MYSMEKIVVAKKDWKCDCCGSLISPGDKYRFLSGRAPKLDENDDQCGVEYWQCHICLDNIACADKFHKAENILLKEKNNG